MKKKTATKTVLQWLHKHVRLGDQFLLSLMATEIDFNAVAIAQAVSRLIRRKILDQHYFALGEDGAPFGIYSDPAEAPERTRDFAIVLRRMK